MKRAVLVAVLGLGLGLPATAAATVTCEYDAPTEALTVTTTGGSIYLYPSGDGEIVGNEWSSLLNICPEAATLSDTSHLEIVDSTSGAFGSIIDIGDVGEFAPGTPITLTLPSPNSDVFVPEGGPGDDSWTFGDGGIDLDGQGGPDVTYSAAAPRRIVATGEGGRNTLSARGGLGTGSPVTTLHIDFTSIRGASDTLEGTEQNDGFDLGTGSDVVRGFGGDDYIDQTGKGDDLIEGGAGEDLLGFFQSPQGVTIDLNRTTQDTGEGIETILGVEDLSGGEGDDTLIGDEGPNRLLGSSKDDTLDGRGGDDYLDGGGGHDTATYANAPAAVVANLSLERAAGGAGSDTLVQTENLIGSPFADDLTGDGQDNTIVGRGGSDVVQTFGGRDLIKVRDGVSDLAICGGETDSVVSDARSVDTISADCENVNALPDLAGIGLHPPPAPQLGLRLDGALEQPLLRQRAVIVEVDCLERACKARARGRGRAPKLRLRPVTAHLTGYSSTRLRLPLGRRQLASIAASLAAGKSPVLIVTVSATANGEVVRRTLVVTATR